jgi:hypothetical protein
MSKHRKKRKSAVTSSKRAAKSAKVPDEHHENMLRKLVLETIGHARAQEILNELASIGL